MIEPANLLVISICYQMMFNRKVTHSALRTVRDTFASYGSPTKNITKGAKKNQNNHLFARHTPLAQQSEPFCTSGFWPLDHRRRIVAKIDLSPFGCGSAVSTTTKLQFPVFPYYDDSLALYFWGIGLCLSSTPEPDWVRILLPLNCSRNSCSTYCVKVLLQPCSRAIVDRRPQEGQPMGTSEYTWEVNQVRYPIHTNLIQPLLLVQTSWTYRAFIPATCLGVTPHTRGK